MTSDKAIFSISDELYKLRKLLETHLEKHDPDLLDRYEEKVGDE